MVRTNYLVAPRRYQLNRHSSSVTQRALKIISLARWNDVRGAPRHEVMMLLAWQHHHWSLAGQGTLIYSLGLAGIALFLTGSPRRYHHTVRVTEKEAYHSRVKVSCGALFMLAILRALLFFPRCFILSWSSLSNHSQIQHLPQFGFLLLLFSLLLVLNYWVIYFLH